MIDDKKIEEAALGYCAKCLDIANRNIDLDEDECVDLYNGFIDGAKWGINEFLKDLLHPAEEIPEKERPVLVVYKHGGYSIEYWEPYNISGQVNYWTLDITQWLYVDDLFPKEGGEQ